MSNSAFKVSLSLFLGELFDGVAEHGPRHSSVTGSEKSLFRREVAFADLSQHPAGGFVDQVFSVTQKFLGDVQSVLELTRANEGIGGDNTDASLPERDGSGKLAESPPTSVQEECAHDIGGGQINQVPIVNIPRAGQVVLVYLLLFLPLAFLKTIDEKKEREETLFMDP